MTQDMQAARDDLAFMKALAHEGRRAPLIAGPFLLAGGVVFGLASVAAWAVAARVVDAPPIWQMWIWVAALIVYAPFWLLAMKGAKRKPGAGALTNRVVGTAWSAIGCAIFAMFAATSIEAVRSHSFIVWAPFACMVLSLYGAGWLLTAIMCDLSWVRPIGLACFAAALIVAIFITSPAVLLIYAVALLLLVALPGWLLMRAEPSDIV